MSALIKMLVILAVLVTAGGTMLAVSQPKSSVAAPFRGLAIGALEVSSKAVEQFVPSTEDVANYERSVIMNALKTMTMISGLKEVPVVSVPTDDMSQFPSHQYPLYPDYVTMKNSQFKYTVDRNGIVKVDLTQSGTSQLLAKIEDLLTDVKEAAGQLTLTPSP